MQRNGVLAVSVGLAICAGVLPLLAALYLSRERALVLESQHLADYANWTVQRADLNLSRAREALERLKLEDISFCSAADVARLQQITTAALSVDEIAVTRDGRVICTTWGTPSAESRLSNTFISLADGYSLRLEAGGLSDPSYSMLVVSYGDYHALVNRDRLVDVLHDTPMKLGLAALDGELVVAPNGLDPLLVSRLAKAETSGYNDTDVYASRRGKDFTALAVSQRITTEWRASNELWKMLPISAVLSVAMIGLIVWFSRRRLSLTGELATGIRRREFVAFYQPIIDLKTGVCVGAEALVRWLKPDGTWVSPEVFIQVAEQNHMIAPITAIMIQNVMSDLGQVLKNHPDMHVAINLAAADVERGEFLSLISNLILARDVQASQIWFEVTERSFFNADRARHMLALARDAGHVVAIDDFGTGYSSLALLESLPLSVLKIDKTFVDAIGRGAATSHVTPHIIDIAHSLKLEIVAEGIESEDQAMYLRESGVQFGQGWLYSKPLPASEFIAYYGHHVTCESDRPFEAACHCRAAKAD